MIILTTFSRQRVHFFKQIIIINYNKYLFKNLKQIDYETK